ncbi:hypothetical protein pwc_9 [Weissella phage PWc]|nr:hypothetical protein pwc_9 [Weissella phage PWc]
MNISIKEKVNNNEEDNYHTSSVWIDRGKLTLSVWQLNCMIWVVYHVKMVWNKNT